jgi:Xaa-Pro aminopeptidase
MVPYARSLVLSCSELTATRYTLRMLSTAGYGANGAVIHYQAEESTALPIGTDSLLLLDSGAQYR